MSEDALRRLLAGGSACGPRNRILAGCGCSETYLIRGRSGRAVTVPKHLARTKRRGDAGKGCVLRRSPAPPLRAACRQGIQVPLGVQPVLPLFDEDAPQAFTHRVDAGLWPAGPLDQFGVAVQP